MTDPNTTPETTPGIGERPPNITGYQALLVQIQDQAARDTVAGLLQAKAEHLQQTSRIPTEKLAGYIHQIKFVAVQLVSTATDQWKIIDTTQPTAQIMFKTDSGGAKDISLLSGAILP